MWLMLKPVSEVSEDTHIIFLRSMTVPCYLREYIQLSRVFIWLYKCVYTCTCTYSVCIHVLLHRWWWSGYEWHCSLYSTSYIILKKLYQSLCDNYTKAQMCTIHLSNVHITCRAVFNIQEACAARAIYSTWFSVSCFFLIFQWNRPGWDYNWYSFYWHNV